MAYHEQGLNPPQLVLDSIEDYMGENDMLRQFLMKRTRATDDKQQMVAINELYISKRTQPSRIIPLYFPSELCCPEHR